MDFIKTWGTALVCAAIIGAICNVLLPRHSIAKAAKALAGIYLAIVMVSPFIGGDIALPGQIEEFAPDESYGTQMYDEAVISRTEEQIMEAVLARLNAEGVAVGEAEVWVNIGDEGGIYCSSVKLTLSEEYRQKERTISDIVYEMCGIQPVFEYRG